MLLSVFIQQCLFVTTIHFPQRHIRPRSPVPAAQIRCVPTAYTPTHASPIPPVSRALKLSTEMYFAPKYKKCEVTKI